MIMHNIVCALSLVIGLMIATNARSAQTWDPFDGVSKLVSWFVNLNEQFDKVIITEKRGQLLRTSDRLRKELYTLETDTRIILDNLPDSVPTTEQHDYLISLASDLLKTVQRMSLVVREFGADLRVNDANDVEIALTIGLRVRAITLTYLRNAIEESKTGKWDAPDIRRKLERGLGAVREAQLSVTSFSQKLRTAKK